MAERASASRNVIGRSESETLRHLAVGAFVALLVVAPELLAGRPGWTVPVIAGLAALAAILSGSSVRPEVRTGVRAALPMIVLGSAVVWTALQCLPLPISWAEHLNPVGVADARAAAELLNRDEPSWWSLSRSPWATLEEVLKGLAVLATFTATWCHVGAGRSGAVIRGIVASGIVLAVATIGHHVMEADSIWFGLFEPPAMGKLVSPLVNENHLAGFLAMVTPLAVALALGARERNQRIGWWAAATLLAGVCVAAVSRSGLGSLVLGLFTLTVLHARRPSRADGSLQALVGAALAALFVALAVGLYFDDLAADWGRTTLVKVRLAIRGLDLVAQSPITGVGRGSYSAAFVRDYGTRYRLEYPENFLVQWASEWGLPVMLLLVVTFGRAIVGGRRTRSLRRMGALAAAVSIGAHELLDFATEEVGIACVAAAVVALALAPSLPTTAPGERSVAAGAIPRWAGVATLAAAFVIGPGLGARRARGIETELAAATATGDYERFDDALERGLTLHPSEPSFPLLAANLGLRRDDPRTGRFLTRAMLLAPGWASPHLLAADWLARRGARRQAWLELREAERLEPGFARTAACRLAQDEASVQEALRVFAEAPETLDRLAECAEVPDALTLQIDEAIVGSGLPGPRVRMATRAAADHRIDDAIAMLEAIEPPRPPRVALSLGQAYLAAGRVEEAVRTLDDPALEPDLAGESYAELARAYAAVHDAESMRAQVGRLRGAARGSPERLGQSYLLLGRLEHELGNDGHALSAFEEAANVDPGSRGLAEVARLAESLGDRTRAYRAWSELCRTEGHGGEACEAATRLRGGG